MCAARGKYKNMLGPQETAGLCGLKFVKILVSQVLLDYQAMKRCFSAEKLPAAAHYYNQLNL